MGEGRGPGGNSSLSSEVTAWVQENGTAVKASEYGGSDTSSDSDSTGDSAGDSTSQSASVYRLDASDVK